MTDKELLEMAAKAADLKTRTDGNVVYFLRNKNPKDDWFEWNPLADDGDALRLAVKLDMDIVYDFDRVMVVFGNKDATCITEYFYDLPQPTDRYKSTRQAIVRAAAEIGKTL